MQWHSTLREGLNKIGQSSPSYDEKWGRFKPDRRFNVDQVPMPFAIDHKTTYEVEVNKENRRDHRVWVVNPGPGLEKRQCTLQVCTSPTNKVRLAIIFRGTGKRISNAEKKACHPKVDVYSQENAWADIKFCVDWVNNTLKKGTESEGENEFVLFCDNLVSQTSEKFLAAVPAINGVVWFGVSVETDIWQPVDCGIGQMLNQIVAKVQDEWLEHDENIDLWLGNSEENLDTKRRRILITYWVGEAYEKLMIIQNQKLEEPLYCFGGGALFVSSGCMEIQFYSNVI